MPQEPLITWKDFQKGIADSPHVGHALLKNVEIDTFSGAARTGKIPTTVFYEWSVTDTTFTANSSTDVCTAASSLGTQNFTGQAVKFSSTGTLPTGLTANVVYFLIYTNGTTFKVAASISDANSGTAIDITGSGTGTHTITPVLPGTMNHYAYDPRASDLFGIDSNGRVWYGLNSNAFLLWNSGLDTGSGGISQANGQGIAIFRTSDGNATYLFAFRNATIDVVNVFGSSDTESPSWTNSWKSLNSAVGSANSHHAVNGQDNIVYFCDDRYVGSIQEKPGQVFDPATSSTYTFNNQALDLPLGAVTFWLEQLGVNLLITTTTDQFIYPWDRSSDSYGLPIPIGEEGGDKRMKNVGNIVYVLAGTRGNIYWTQGTYVRPFKTIPRYLTDIETIPISGPMSWGGVAAAYGRLLVGVSAFNGESGVYMIDPDGITTLDNFPSTGQANVTAIFALSDFYQMGYAGGGDTMDTARFSTLGSVVLQSPLYRIGNHKHKETISLLEYQIANPVSGSIRVKYRTSLSGTFTDITTFSTSSSATSDTFDCGLIDLENIQFQVELSGSIDFMELRAYR